MPNIGQAFSPGFLQLLQQQKQTRDDRNLRAAIADREFIESARRRSLDASKTSESNRLRFAGLKEQARQFDKQVEGGGDAELVEGARQFDERLKFQREQEQRKVASDSALADKRAAETYKTLLLTDPQAAKLWAEVHLTRQQTRKAKSDADVGEKTVEPRIRIAGAEADTAAAEADEARVSADNAQRMIDMEIDDIASKIQDRKLSQDFKKSELDWRKEFHALDTEAEQKRFLQGQFTKYASMLSKFDPVFGRSMIESNPEAANFIKEQIAIISSALVEMGEDEGAVRQLLIKRINQRMGAAPGGGSSGGIGSILEQIRAENDALKKRLQDKQNVEKPDMAN